MYETILILIYALRYEMRSTNDNSRATSGQFSELILTKVLRKK